MFLVDTLMYCHTFTYHSNRHLSCLHKILKISLEQQEYWRLWSQKIPSRTNGRRIWWCSSRQTSDDSGILGFIPWQRTTCLLKNMAEKITSYLQELTDDNRLLIKKLCIASVALYVVFQLLGFLLPLAITGLACYWVYKNVLTENPRVMKWRKLLTGIETW